MSPKPIPIEPGMTINIDGKEMTYEDIKERTIDSILYRRHLQKLKNSQ